MIELRFNVVVEGEMVAENMRLEYALVVAKAMLEEYWQQAAKTGLTVSITTRKGELQEEDDYIVGVNEYNAELKRMKEDDTHDD